MKSAYRILMISFAVVLLLFTLWFMARTWLLTSETDARTAMVNRFLESVLNSDQEVSMEMLTDDAREAVNNLCGGVIRECFNRIIPTDAGEFTGIVYENMARWNSSDWALRYHVIWSSYNGLIVVTITQSGQSRRVSGWRGLIPFDSSEEERTDFISGELEVNIFPPPS